MNTSTAHIPNVQCLDVVCEDARFISLLSVGLVPFMQNAWRAV